MTQGVFHFLRQFGGGAVLLGDKEQRVVTKAVVAAGLLGDDALLRAFHVEAFPTAYFLDSGGRVQGSVTGYTTTLGLLARLIR